MKKIYLLLTFCTVLLLNSVSAQTVQVVVNPGTSGNIVCGGAAYHASESIYLASEVGTTNFLTAATAINHIDFSLNALGTSGGFGSYTIYMKEVAAGTTTLATGNYSTTGYKSVFSGTFTPTATGWVGVDLTTPFTRTSGTKNLEVMLVRKDGVTPVGYVWNASVSNATDATFTLTTTRRYNGATTPGATSSLTASIYREAIQLRHVPTTDASLTKLGFPTSSCYNSNQSISVTITNSGKTTAINAGQATVALSVSNSNTFTGSTANIGTIAVGGTEVVTFSGINLNNAGPNDVMAIVSFTGDGDPSNDTIRSTSFTAGTISTFPVVEDAEAPSVFVHLKALSGPRDLWNWMSNSYINTDMATTIGVTDSLYAHGGTHYYLFDAYSGANSTGYISILYSECLTVPAANYSVGFWMTHDTLFQTSLDSIYVDVSTDRGVTWNRVQGYQRVDQSGTFDTQIGWQQNTVDLSAYSGQTIQLAFEGVSAYGNVMGVDDINIYNALPVRYLSFKGARVDKQNRLNWTTTAETDNTGFEVQRSLDGQHYEKLDFVPSIFTGANSTYSYSDPQSDNRVSYYRLKQIDKNGKFSYSTIVIIKSNEGSNIELSAIYPNPVSADLNLKVNALNADKLAIVITDAAGKTVANYHASVTAGMNNFEYNVSNLRTGTYYIKLIGTEGSTQTQLFEKK